ncbi:hypothetical protein NM688_g3841 [Phlebia brevispora]|uniref:Uncharacterized protein n=1 Tax=Phlebia brevispora TaxID=194682 RepID=A0ACC1T4B4_9APHY|nr:hypothetical protein NM688_g3841 [Phlebia brevispora]
MRPDLTSGNASTSTPHRHKTTGLLDKVAACPSSAREKWRRNATFSRSQNRSGSNGQGRHVSTKSSPQATASHAERNGCGRPAYVHELPDLFSTVPQLYEAESGMYQYCEWSEQIPLSSADVWEAGWPPDEFSAFDDQELEAVPYTATPPSASASCEAQDTCSSGESTPFGSRESTPLHRGGKTSSASRATTPGSSGGRSPSPWRGMDPILLETLNAVCAAHAGKLCSSTVTRIAGNSKRTPARPAGKAAPLMEFTLPTARQACSTPPRESMLCSSPTRSSSPSQLFSDDSTGTAETELTSVDGEDDERKSDWDT